MHFKLICCKIFTWGNNLTGNKTKTLESNSNNCLNVYLAKMRLQGFA